MTEERKKPLKSFAVGPLSVAMWENPANDGSDRTFRSVTISKAYFDKKENEWDRQSVSINLTKGGQTVSLCRRHVWEALKGNGQARPKKGKGKKSKEEPQEQAIEPGVQ